MKKRAAETPLSIAARTVKATVRELAGDEPADAISQAILLEDDPGVIAHLGRAYLERVESLSDAPYRFGGALYMFSDMATQLKWVP